MTGRRSLALILASSLPQDSVGSSPRSRDAKRQRAPSTQTNVYALHVSRFKGTSDSRTNLHRGKGRFCDVVGARCPSGRRGCTNRGRRRGPVGGPSRVMWSLRSQLPLANPAHCSASTSRTSKSLVVVSPSSEPTVEGDACALGERVRSSGPATRLVDADRRVEYHVESDDRDPKLYGVHCAD
jgi:hypothetical protein